MKAVVYDRYGGPEVLQLSDIDLPEPAKGQIRVRVLASAVNLSDWEYLVGSPLWVRMIGGLFSPKVPVLGSDIVGLVDKLGAGVSGFEIGQRVMGDYVMTRGGFAEYACVPANETVVVPDALSDEVAACLPQAGGIAVAGTADLQQGARFLINGAGGGSGTMALQLAKAAGAYVTAVDNKKKVAWLKTLGADEVIDYHKFNFTEVGREWDKILDMVATRGPAEISRVLAEGGDYMALGGGVPTLLALVLGGRFCSRNHSIGMLLVPSGRALTKSVAQLAVEGKIAPHLEEVLPLSSVPEALLRTGQGDVLGKIVIKHRLT
ncbi:NAD(P)-dependent alcohol dehydrogenase [Aliiroseovarius sp. KMU-50]|uniref:NAD(P)-dependent alcohol dehydrogenase n=1 Tax=Aliiroseovarius salicola TaxID=3009082 RepID=A0ABT4W716_9RHOB|nr:NAD(P)-dependent alcohol dehydrogenase [Aliiroseovarius sp. KMU-50]MDA5095733.1 NAD(P)-dependent alcohol dehydrogenase [Aliiroseovarius sp. KMU-50]